MDIPAMKERDGYIGLVDFPGQLIAMFQRIGFIYHSRVVIWKDPLVEATRTKAIGLMHKQIAKDSAMCRNGLPDYLITFRKPGNNPEPVAHPDGFTSYIGDGEIPGDKKKRESVSTKSKEFVRHEKYNADPIFSHHVWRRYASPVWMDIDQSDTLQYRSARDHKDERHICPLQLPVIRRAIELWTNKNDIVLSPFGGIGSEPVTAIEMGRRAIAIELKDSYYKQMKANCAIAKINNTDLFSDKEVI
jgi:DNA modification methylase